MQPRTGVADINQQISILQHLEEAGSDISSVQLDAASRSKLYAKAQLGCELSQERNASQLNGFPIPIYGVEGVRRLVQALKHPFQLRGGGPDHKFTYEIALGGLVSGLEGGFICYCMPYDKLTSPTEALKNWQYVDKLCAQYAKEHGVIINREYFGVLTATLIAPSIAIVVNIIQALMSAVQGVVSISVGYAEQGNRTHDIAAMQVLEEQVNHYLTEYGHHNCRVTTVFHQFMAAFPADHAKAQELIYNSSITATLAGATKMMVKTAVESIKIPDRFDNEQAVKLSGKGRDAAQATPKNLARIRLEKKMIRAEVKQIMDAVIELGNGSVTVGAIKAIEEGVLDIPWSPNIYNKNKVMGIRDVDGAVRFLDFGNLPLDGRTKDFHMQKVNARKDLERDASVFSLLEKDLSRIWKNDYKQWPLDGIYVS